MYGSEGATMANVQRAAKMANAHDFIMRIPDAYKAQVSHALHCTLLSSASSRNRGCAFHLRSKLSKHMGTVKELGAKLCSMSCRDEK